MKTGTASYYSNSFHGRKTASGEKYNSEAFTAAHKHLPFGTRVRVTDKKTGKSVIVRINDRGPQQRLIDLSKGAAKALGILQRGVAAVKIEILQK